MNTTPEIVDQFFEAAGGNDVKAVRQFLDDGMNIEQESTWAEGRTALHHAAQNNAKDVAELLIFRGANVNARQIQGGETPLHLAATVGASEIVELLIVNGADIVLKTIPDVDWMEEKTPLEMARDRVASIEKDFKNRDYQIAEVDKNADFQKGPLEEASEYNQRLRDIRRSKERILKDFLPSSALDSTKRTVELLESATKQQSPVSPGEADKKFAEVHVKRDPLTHDGTAFGKQ